MSGARRDGEELRKDEEPPKIPEVLPVLPLRDIVIFPFMIVPLYVSRERSIKAVDQALADNRMILLAAQKRQDDEDPGPDDIYSVGTVALIMRMLKLPDGRIRVLVQGIGRARILSFEEGHPHLQARIEAITEPEVDGQGPRDRGPDAQRQGRPREVGQPGQAHLARGHRHRHQHGGAGPPGRPHRVATSTSRWRARRRSWRPSTPSSGCAACTS